VGDTTNLKEDGKNSNAKCPVNYKDVGQTGHLKYRKGGQTKEGKGTKGPY